MPEAARKDDKVRCIPGLWTGISTITGGSSNVFTNSKNAVRVDDPDACPATIAQGSSTVFINGKPAARKGDLNTDGCPIIEGSGNVFIGG